MSDERLGEKYQLTRQFDDAVRWAAELHRAQGKKAYPGPSRVPYLAHLLLVAGSVLDAGGDETAGIAALLHDSMEDRDVRPEEIADRTSQEVANIVVACTDTGDSGVARTAENSRARKIAYLNHLRRGAHLSSRALLVAIADKLQNVRSLVSDYVSDPETVWRKFNVTDPMVNLSYYYQLDKCLNKLVREDDLPARRLGQELHRVVTELLTLAGSPSEEDLASALGPG
jgi:(p)ppGpp synthase/HD superfamily hydrolase